MWTLRTKREGSQALVTDYQKDIIKAIVSSKETTSSGEMYKLLINLMGDKAPSRASVIFFLNDLVDAKYANFKDGTGKGGHHRLYYTNLTSELFEKKVYVDINQKIKDALDNIFP